MITHTNPPIPLIESKDYGSAGVDAQSVDIGKARKTSLLFTFGAITGNSILILYAGATDGAKTTALAFRYRMSSGDFKAASADQYGDLTDVASTGLTLAATTFDHRSVVIEVEPIDMPSGKPWLTASIDATATAINVGAFGIPNPRYVSDNMPTVV